MRTRSLPRCTPLPLDTCVRCWCFICGYSFPFIILSPSHTAQCHRATHQRNSHVVTMVQMPYYFFCLEFDGWWFYVPRVGRCLSRLSRAWPPEFYLSTRVNRFLPSLFSLCVVTRLASLYRIWRLRWNHSSSFSGSLARVPNLKPETLALLLYNEPAKPPLARRSTLPRN